MDHFEIAVIGGGLAGLIAALQMARGGRRTVLLAPESKPDRRTTALMDQSIRLIDRLGLWAELAPLASPLSTMRIIDGTDRLLRAPPVSFRSAEVDLEAFGYNFPNAALLPILQAAVDREPNLTRLPRAAESVTLSATGVTVTLDGGETVTADFAIGADGRASPTRDAAGITVRRWSYPQTALVLNFAHDLPHQDISTEFHTPDGPFTQVPLKGRRSSLVWVMKPAQAEAYAGLSPDALSLKIETRMQSMLGKVTVEDGVQAWPLSGMVADRFGKGRVALIGEAAHVFPPIGAQGLNLSLRDIETLGAILTAPPLTPIPADAGDVFDRRRRVDILSRTASVDLLNRSLLSDFLPVQMLRAAGLHILSAVGPLRNIVMREGVEPGRGLKAIPDLFRRKRA